MSDLVRSVESFAWEGGMVHDGSEFPADAEVVSRFPHFFVAVEAPADEQPVKRRPGRSKREAS